MDSAAAAGAPRMLLYSRAGCHLCDQAREIVRAVAAASEVAWSEQDVDVDAELQDRFGELVPVVLVDGVRQGYWHLDAARLRRALA